MIAFVLSGISTLKTPPKNSQAASHATRSEGNLRVRRARKGRPGAPLRARLRLRGELPCQAENPVLWCAGLRCLDTWLKVA